MASVRLFIATSLTRSIKKRIEKLLLDLKSSLGVRNVRWVKPPGIHLTFKFLGDTSLEQVPEIQKIMDDIAMGYAPFHFSVEGIGCFPNCKRPRVIWIGVEEKTGALQNLQEKIELAMVDLGFPEEGRSFHPHLTLGRIRNHVRKSERKNLGETISDFPSIQVGDQILEAISLIKSDLQPSGAVYTHLCTSKLRGEN